MESLSPWSRQKDESDAAWNAFRAFRDRGREDDVSQRRLAIVASRTRWSRSTLAKWSARHSWQERAAAWDRVIDGERQAVAQRAARETAEENVAHVKRISELLGLELAKLLEQSRDSTGPILKPAEITKLLEAERRLLELGEPLEARSEARVDYKQLSLEEKKQLLGLIRKSRNGQV